MNELPDLDNPGSNSDNSIPKTFIYDGQLIVPPNLPPSTESDQWTQNRLSRELDAEHQPSDKAERTQSDGVTRRASPILLQEVQRGLDQGAADRYQRATEASSNMQQKLAGGSEPTAEISILNKQDSARLVKGSYSPDLPTRRSRESTENIRITFEFPADSEERIESLIEYLKHDGIHVVDELSIGSTVKRRRGSRASEQGPPPVKQKQSQKQLQAGSQNSEILDEVLIHQLSRFQHVDCRKNQDPNRRYKCTLDRDCLWSSDDETSWVRHQHAHYPTDVYLCRDPGCCKKRKIPWWSPRRDSASLHLKKHYRENQVDTMLEEGFLRIPDCSSQYPRTCVFLDCSERFSSMEHRLNHMKDHFKNGDIIDAAKIDSHSRKLSASASPGDNKPKDKDDEPEFDGDSGADAAGGPSPAISSGSRKTKENHPSHAGHTGNCCNHHVTQEQPTTYASDLLCHIALAHSAKQFWAGHKRNESHTDKVQEYEMNSYASAMPRSELPETQHLKPYLSEADTYTFGHLSGIFYGNLRHRPMRGLIAWQESKFSVMYAVITFPSFKEPEPVPELTTGTTLESTVSKTNTQQPRAAEQNLQPSAQVEWASDDSTIAPEAVLEYSVPMVRNHLIMLLMLTYTLSPIS